ncbi:MAG: class II fructose-bisphosphate aldolase [bacterium]|nr:class II fructose-bisphosphate aldolase [bacterium]
MPSKNLKYYLKKAQKEGWAIGQFNISNLETLRAIVLAAQKLKSPALIGTSEGESKFIGLEQAVVLVRVFREKTGLPIFLNLDHGKTFEYIKKAISAGYDAVNFDGSGLPLQENIRETKKVVEYAKKFKALAEGAVGVVGGALTNPEEALEFVKETKVDALALAVGSIHGIGSSGTDPSLKLKRLKEIKEKLGNIPLVLHGGSGVQKKDIKAGIKLGIVKININTELRMAYTNTLRQVLKKKEIVPYKYMPEVIGAVQKLVEEKIKLFGSENKINIC